MKRLTFAAALAATFAGFADEAVWTGAKDGNWDTVTATLVQGVQSVPAGLKWNVTVDGVAAPQMKVRLAGGKLICRYPTGLILLVR